MASNEKVVSPYIPQQFPAHYRENSPQFVEFVKVYYEWLEAEDQAVGRAKRLSEYRDVDETLEDFIVFFKNKYLPLFKFDTQTDKRMIIKHVLDLYRSKGTERGIDLFFRLVYGKGAEVYYPSTDLFRLSDNIWVKRDYLELSQNIANAKFPGKKVIGKRSGATAFSEKFITKKSGDKYAYVLFISNIEGQFETGEQVYFDGMEEDTLPIIVGSLNDLDITSGSSGFSVGDVVRVESDNGSGALARVANTANSTGAVKFTLLDGGWGYTANAKVFVSEKVLTLDSLIPDLSINNKLSPRYANSAFFRLEQIVQPLATMEYEEANNTINANDVMTSYYANGDTISTIRVISNEVTNTTAGILTVSLLTGNSEVNTYFYTPANAVIMNVQTFTDISAYGNVVGSSSNLVLSVSNTTARFGVNDFVFQTNTINNRIDGIGKINAAEYGGTSGSLRLTNVSGAFTVDANVSLRYANGVDSSEKAHLNKMTATLGVANITGSFIASSAGIRSVDSNTVANVTSISFGSFASFEVSNTFAYADSYAIYPDLLDGSQMSVVINAFAYGFSEDPAANGESTISSALAFYNGNVGTITALANVNPGKEYSAPPFVFIFDPYISGFGKKDYILTISPLTSNFSVGEVVSQENGAKGLIKASNSSALSVRRTSLFIDFDKDESNNVIIGASTGATATLIDALVDLDSLPVGLDAVVSANVEVSNGIVTKLDLLASGFSYIQDETVTFTSSDDLRVGTAKVNLIKHGTTDGTFMNEGSFLSDGKYLFDGYYYQEYSYDIQTPVPKSKFEEVYKSTMHLAGTQLFSTYVHSSINDTKITATLPEGANTQPVV